MALEAAFEHPKFIKGDDLAARFRVGFAEVIKETTLRIALSESETRGHFVSTMCIGASEDLDHISMYPVTVDNTTDPALGINQKGYSGIGMLNEKYIQSYPECLRTMYSKLNERHPDVFPKLKSIIIIGYSSGEYDVYVWSQNIQFESMPNYSLHILHNRYGKLLRTCYPGTLNRALAHQRHINNFFENRASKITDDDLSNEDRRIADEIQKRNSYVAYKYSDEGKVKLKKLNSPYVEHKELHKRKHDALNDANQVYIELISDEQRVRKTKEKNRKKKKAKKRKKEEDRKRIIKIQSLVRGFLARHQLFKKQQGIVKVQSLVRGFLVRQRRKSAAIKVQSLVRGFLIRSRFSKRQYNIVKIQTLVRVFLERKRSINVQRKCAAIKIQSLVRGFLAQSFFRDMKIDQTRKLLIDHKRAISSIKIQSLVRGFLTRRWIHNNMRQPIYSSLENHYHHNMQDMQRRLQEYEQYAYHMEQGMQESKYYAYCMEQEVNRLHNIINQHPSHLVYCGAFWSEIKNEEVIPWAKFSDGVWRPANTPYHN
jgi:hypothetical protein